MSAVRGQGTSVDELLRQNESLRGELARIRDERGALTSQLQAAQLDRRADREGRRAALNLLEDAIEARHAEQRENEVRRRVEAELRENERALQEAASRQAFLLRLADVIRLLPDPQAITRAAVELLGDHLGDVTIECLLVDDDARFVQTAAVYRDGGLSQNEEGARRLLGDLPEVEASVRSASDDFAIDGAAWTVAVLKRGRKVCAVLTVRGHGRSSWTDAERHLQHEVAERMWGGAERALVEAALRDRNAERARLLEDAHAAQSEAERANRAKDEFLATLSHELRTPLAAVLLWAGALKSGAVGADDLPMAIDAIIQSAKGQSRLIEDLLDLSRLSSGHFDVALGVVAVAEIMHAAVDVVRPSAEAKQLELTVDVAEDLGLASIDGGRIQQVLWNLLTNAIKFTDAGGRVTLRGSAHGDAIELEVADTGEGISPEFLPQMFERFRQADMNDTRRHAGLGIGLALCRSLVELHGGTITAESEGLGRGSRFVVRLPRGDVERAPEGVVEVAEEVDVRLDDVRVLLVEDDENILEAMRRNLEQIGAEVIAMRTGAEALALLDEERADSPGGRVGVLLCETGLPGMSGYELIEQLAKRSEAKRAALLPACALSGYARDVDRLRAVEAGFDFHLAKPVTRERLIAAVEDLRAIARARLT